MAYQKFEVVLDGNLVNNKIFDRPCTNEELEEAIKNSILYACGFPIGLEEQITVKLLERRDE